MKILICAVSEERCVAVAEEEGFALSDCLLTWDIASFLRCTGHEEQQHGDESMYEIPIADWMLMCHYSMMLTRNPYNGFGLRDMYPERADSTVLSLAAWVNSDNRTGTLPIL